MKLLRLLSALAAGIGLCSTASASSYQGIVTNVAPSNGKVYIVVQYGGFDGAVSSCSSTAGIVYEADPNTPFGRALMATALAAKLTGKTVYAIGNGTCGTGSLLGPFEGMAGIDLKG